MSKILNFFEESFYINLDYREDRKALFEKRAKDIGISPIRFSGITPNEGEYQNLNANHKDSRRKWKVGCTLSHQSIVKIAKDKGLNNVLIFEDDCIFLDRFIDKATKCVNDLKENNWDLIYFGGQPNQYAQHITDNLGKIENGGIYSTHSYGINHTFYDKLLSISPNQVDTIDILYLNYSSNHRNLFVSKDLLTIQDITYSDLWDTKVNAQEICKVDWDKFITQPLNKNK